MQTKTFDTISINLYNAKFLKLPFVNLYLILWTLYESKLLLISGLIFFIQFAYLLSKDQNQHFNWSATSSVSKAKAGEKIYNQIGLRFRKGLVYLRHY